MTEPKDNPGLALTLGRIPSGLFIVTLRSGDKTNAFLASFVQQTSFSPPTIAVAVKDGRPAAGLLEEGSAFAINVIGDKDAGGLMKHFARGFGPDDNPYDGVEVVKGSTGVELLVASLGALECKPVSSAQAGDHRVWVGEVVDGRSFDEDGRSAIHLRKSGFNY